MMEARGFFQTIAVAALICGGLAPALAQDNRRRTALAVAKAYYSAMEQRDREGVATLLSPQVTKTFAFSADGRTRPAAIFEGKEEVLGYTDAVFSKFSRIGFVDQVFMASGDGKTIFVQAQGDMLTAGSGLSYRNLYIVRFDVHRGRIVSMLEYANSVSYAKLGIPPTAIEIKAVERAQRVR